MQLATFYIYKLLKAYDYKLHASPSDIYASIVGHSICHAKHHNAKMHQPYSPPSHLPLRITRSSQRHRQLSAPNRQLIRTNITDIISMALDPLKRRARPTLLTTANQRQ